MKFIITSEFGAVEAVRGLFPHTGIDVAMPMDTPLKSFCNAVVESVVDYGNQNIGKGVILRTSDGHRYIYGHMDQVTVYQGEKVHSGDLLGLSGSSGNSTGPHLHFGEQFHGQYVDPTHIISKVTQAIGGDPVPTEHKKNLIDWLFSPFDMGKYVHDALLSAVHGALQAIGEVVMDSLYLIALCGGGILIILQLLGFDHKWLKPSVLVGAYILIRYIFA